MRSDDEKKVHPVLKVLGPLILVVGIIMFFGGAVALMTGDGIGFGFLPFFSIPVMFVGGVMTQFAYMGKMTKYMHKRMGPIQKDYVNYMLDGTKDHIKEIVHGKETSKPCAFCGDMNDVDAKFCDNCGKPLTKACRHCLEENEQDAKFCKSCGKAL